MKRLISLLVVGVFLVATRTFGGVKVQQVGEDRYRIVNKRKARFVGSWHGHEKKMRKQGATLCLGLEYSWMIVIDQGSESINAVYFHSLEEAQEYAEDHLRHRSPDSARPLDCEALSPRWMRSAEWLQKFKAEQRGK